MATLSQMTALNGRKVRMTLTNGASVLATVIDVQDNIKDQVAIEIHEVIAKATRTRKQMKVGKHYAVSLEDLQSVEPLPH